ncbi:hypothetical protein IZY60_07925 [Lutibacter sp. B2]|nr:hypothetical protein [Lutibacter sp. B2]
MAKKEKVMLYVTIALVLFLVGKTLYFDEVKVSGDALKFKQFVEKSVEENEKYNNFFKRHNLIDYKVVSIKKIKESGKSRIMYLNEENKYVEGIIAGEYQGKVRGYFLHIYPYKEFKVKSNWIKE